MQQLPEQLTEQLAELPEQLTELPEQLTEELTGA